MILTKPRVEVVHRLIHGAARGMHDVAEGSTAAEVYSAYISMANTAVNQLLDNGDAVTRSNLRTVLQLMLMKCSEDTPQ